MRRGQTESPAPESRSAVARMELMAIGIMEEPRWAWVSMVFTPDVPESGLAVVEQSSMLVELGLVRLLAGDRLATTIPERGSMETTWRLLVASGGQRVASGWRARGTRRRRPGVVTGC